MKQGLILDFETASGCDLTKSGAWRYAEDPSTEVLCLAYRLTSDRGPASVWVPNFGHQAGTDLYEYAEDPEVVFIAHNVGFEKAIWRHIMVRAYGFPDVPNERWHDIMAVCAMKAMPLKLEHASLVFRLPNQKDKDGSKFTKAMSKPNRKGWLDRSPESLQRVYTYCQQDINAEQDLHRRVGWLTPEERRVWLLDQTINERGVLLDAPFVAAAIQVVAKASGPLAEEFQGLTGGLKFTQRDKIMKWVLDQGVTLPDMKKETLDAVLGGGDDDPDGDGDGGEDWEAAAEGSDIDLPNGVRRALSIRRLIGSASVKKLLSMELCTGADGRARGLLQYHGAGPGRWAGRLLQPQNFPRGSLRVGDGLPDPEVLVDAILTGDPDYVECLFGPAVEAVVSSLRHSIIAAPGKTLLVGDFSQIEARIVLALAGQTDKVEVFRKFGSRVYIDMAELIFSRKINKKVDVEEYTIGKNTVLGCGFQMGARKFLARYAKGHDLAFAKRVVDTYRNEFAPAVPDLWAALEEASLQTVLTGQAHEAYGVEYRLEDGWMTARLPSGRKLWYWNPRATRKAMPWDKDDIRPAWTYQAKKLGRWIPCDAFGGLETENVVQALARDIMVDAMVRAEDNGFPIILTVHDELVTEPWKGDADVAALGQIMSELAPWAKALGLPIAAECWMGDRYHK